MPSLAQASVSSGCQSSRGGDALLVLYPPPYDLTTYIRNFLSYFDTHLFSILLMAGSALTVAFGPIICDNGVDGWRKR